MPNVNLSNDEYEVVLKMREAVEKPNGYCEDYPCCGHTPADPCTRQWYDHPDAFNPLVNPHCFCEHEYGICDVDDRSDEECKHDNQTYYADDNCWECDYCGEDTSDAHTT